MSVDNYFVSASVLQCLNNGLKIDEHVNLVCRTTTFQQDSESNLNKVTKRKANYMF